LRSPEVSSIALEDIRSTQRLNRSRSLVGTPSSSEMTMTGIG
jgi:hypothetical protein